MEASFKFWKVLDKRRLLLTMMEQLAGGAHVSFEGDLRGLTLLSIVKDGSWEARRGGCCGQAGELSWSYVRGYFVHSARFLETGSQAASP
jgi:hypothetical protein